MVNAFVCHVSGYGDFFPLPFLPFTKLFRAEFTILRYSTFGVIVVVGCYALIYLIIVINFEFHLSSSLSTFFASVAHYGRCCCCHSFPIPLFLFVHTDFRSLFDPISRIHTKKAEKTITTTTKCI